MKTGIELITEERQRQIEVEGWTPDHDDKHTGGELAAAAAVYALPNEVRDYAFVEGEPYSVRDMLWPWKEAWLKLSPENRIRELQKAGALIAAEIDRLQRAAQKSRAGGGGVNKDDFRRLEDEARQRDRDYAEGYRWVCIDGLRDEMMSPDKMRDLLNKLLKPKDESE